MDKKTHQMMNTLNKSSKEITDMFTTMYVRNKMTGREISDWLYKEKGIDLNERSIQRRVAKVGKTRTMGIEMDRRYLDRDF